MQLEMRRSPFPNAGPSLGQLTMDSDFKELCFSLSDSVSKAPILDC